jgi:hypothetical protein
MSRTEHRVSLTPEGIAKIERPAKGRKRVYDTENKRLALAVYAKRQAGVEVPLLVLRPLAVGDHRQSMRISPSPRPASGPKSWAAWWPTGATRHRSGKWSATPPRVEPLQGETVEDLQSAQLRS